jgi:hypothetical protein
MHWPLSARGFLSVSWQSAGYGKPAKLPLMPLPHHCRYLLSKVNFLRLLRDWCGVSSIVNLGRGVLGKVRALRCTPFIREGGHRRPILERFGVVSARAHSLAPPKRRRHAPQAPDRRRSISGWRLSLRHRSVWPNADHSRSARAHTRYVQPHVNVSGRQAGFLGRRK